MIKRKKLITLIVLGMLLIQNMVWHDSLADGQEVYAVENQPEIKQVTNTLTSESIMDTSVRLSWIGYVDELIELDYEVYRNGEIVTTVDKLAYTDSELAPDTEYTYVIRAKNKEGVRFGESNELVVRTKEEEIVKEHSDVSNVIDVVNEESIEELEMNVSPVEDIAIESEEEKYNLQYFTLKYKLEELLFQFPELEELILEEPELWDEIFSMERDTLREKVLTGDIARDIPPHILFEYLEGYERDNLIITSDELLRATGASAMSYSSMAMDSSITTNSSMTIANPDDRGQFVDVRSSYYHGLAIKNDGTIWSWGFNIGGQLGDGSTTDKTSPVQVSGISDGIAISSGRYHSMALKSDGTVWSWGANNCGQLGDGTTTNKTSPVQVSGISGVIAIASGALHSMALKNDGTVWSWGYNGAGQLGDDTTTDKTNPVQVSGISGVIAIASGWYHSTALKDDGTVWSWGFNNSGQLGDGTSINRRSPVQVSGISEVVAIASGRYHSMALKNDGTVWSWGKNEYGQLGDGTSADRKMPVQVSGISGVTAIASGASHGMALKNDGTVWSWGYNHYGQLGSGTIGNMLIPLPVNGLSGIISIAGGETHSIAIKNDGTVWSWGNDIVGQLGNGALGETLVPAYAFGTPRVEPTNLFNLMLINANISTLTNTSFNITYDSTQLALYDLSTLTEQKETTTGTIEGTGITVTKCQPGLITYTVDKSLLPNQKWSGIMNYIQFDELTPEGRATISYTIQPN